MVNIEKERVEIRNHAYQRAMSDRFDVSKPKSKNKAKESIEKAIKYSKLLKLNEDGTELRGHNGKIYVCAREGMSGRVRVITVLKGNRYVR